MVLLPLLSLLFSLDISCVVVVGVGVVAEWLALDVNCFALVARSAV